MRCTSEERQARARGPEATWHTTGQGTRASLLPTYLDAGCMGRCAGLVKADGGAEPTCKIHFFPVRSLDEGMNLRAGKRRVSGVKNQKERSRILGPELRLEGAPGACAGAAVGVHGRGQLPPRKPALLASPAVRPQLLTGRPEPALFRRGWGWELCPQCLTASLRGTKERMDVLPSTRPSHCCVDTGGCCVGSCSPRGSGSTGVKAEQGMGSGSPGRVTHRRTCTNWTSVDLP